LHGVQQRWAGTASANFGQAVAEGRNGLAHFGFGGFLDVSDGHVVLLRQRSVRVEKMGN
jgi:hypothetical protein